MRLFGFKPADGEASGDTMPFYWNDEWHLFYLKPPPGAWGYPDRAMNSMGHLVSRDLVDWKVLPNALAPGAPGQPDCHGVWTGSLIEHEGVFHFFYTGFNREPAPRQTICHATSDDLLHWVKDNANPILRPDPERYEVVDWRDPFLYRDDRRGGFAMLIAARLSSGPEFRRGCIVVARSNDLRTWDVSEPPWTPRVTHCMECPELFQLGDYWYLVFSRYSEHAQTIYRVARSPDGPWQSRRLDSIDGRRFYAAKSASDGARRVTFAWTAVHTRDRADAPWEWGGELCSPRELVSLPDGTLISRLVPEVAASYAAMAEVGFVGEYGDWRRDGATIAGNAPGTYGHGFLDVQRQELLLDTEIEIAPGTTAAGILIEPESDLASGYYVSIEPLKGRVAFNLWPPAMDPLWETLAFGGSTQTQLDNPLVERLLATVPEDGRYRVRLLRKGSLLECFVADQVAISYRIYQERDKMFGLFVQEGSARFRDLTIRC